MSRPLAQTPSMISMPSESYTGREHGMGVLEPGRGSLPPPCALGVGGVPQLVSPMVTKLFSPSPHPIGHPILQPLGLSSFIHSTNI